MITNLKKIQNLVAKKHLEITLLPLSETLTLPLTELVKLPLDVDFIKGIENSFGYKLDDEIITFLLLGINKINFRILGEHAYMILNIAGVDYQIANYSPKYYNFDKEVKLFTKIINHNIYLEIFTTRPYEIDECGLIVSDSKGVIYYFSEKEEKLSKISDTFFQFLEKLKPQQKSNDLEIRYTKNGTPKIVDRSKWYQDENGEWKEIRFKK